MLFSCSFFCPLGNERNPTLFSGESLEFSKQKENILKAFIWFNLRENLKPSGIVCAAFELFFSAEFPHRRSGRTKTKRRKLRSPPKDATGRRVAEIPTRTHTGPFLIDGDRETTCTSRRASPRPRTTSSFLTQKLEPPSGMLPSPIPHQVPLESSRTTF